MMLSAPANHCWTREPTVATHLHPFSRHALPPPLCAFFLTALAAHSAEKPNIIFLLADDIGYADLSCYGAKHAKTPNLDRLAAQGCRFTDAHSSASICAPTCRAFLTGVLSWRQQPGFEHSGLES
jgi:hypothetical protein